MPTRSPSLGGPEEDDTAPGGLSDQLSAVNGAAAVSTEQQVSAEGGGVENYRSQLVIDLVKAGVHEQVLEKGLGTDGEVTEQQMLMQVLSQNKEEDGDIRAAAGGLLDTNARRGTLTDRATTTCHLLHRHSTHRRETAPTLRLGQAEGAKKALGRWHVHHRRD